MKNDQINYIQFEEIETDKWDTCIAKSPNALVYAQSWYLDKVCDRWDALVFGDYQYVMPLTFRKKIGINYLYQPFFCQQLGIFPTPTKEILRQFLYEAMKLYPFAEINLNAMNLPVQNVTGSFMPRKNFLLPLERPYSEIAKNYSSYTKRKLKRAKENKLSLVHTISVEEYTKFRHMHSKVKVENKAYLYLQNIISFALTHCMGQIYGVYSPSNELCAAAFFVRYKNRVTYMGATTSPTGRKLSATFLLIDQFIIKNANGEFIIDFEGSMVSGIAKFYEGFGASPEVYHHLRWNKLPVWLKWLKK